MKRLVLFPFVHLSIEKLHIRVGIFFFIQSNNFFILFASSLKLQQEGESRNAVKVLAFDNKITCQDQR